MKSDWLAMFAPLFKGNSIRGGGFRTMASCAARPRRVLGKIATLEAMSIEAVSLACGHGWRVLDIRCTSGPRDRPFEERHSEVCIAVVTGGTFTYRTTQGT